MTRTSVRAALGLAMAVGALVWTPGGVAQAPAAQATATQPDYVSRAVMIPMRDGVRLAARIWAPRNADGPLPILMTRSPYGFTEERIRRGLGSAYRELAADGFIFVFQDIRGRFGSEGEFVNLRPKRTARRGVDESTDTYDTIDWLLKNQPNNNGRVGVWGVSYGGWTAAMATIEPHPALKAVSSQASPNDMFIGDDFNHNGAFRLDYAWSWVSALETDGRTMKAFDFGGSRDAYDWYLKQRDLASLDRQHLGRTLPSWRDFVSHPNYDAFWQRQRTSGNLSATVATPTLIVAGWYDQEDLYGPLSIYGSQEAGDRRNLNYLVVGPWNHGGWRGPGANYGPYKFGAETGDWYRGSIELPWFRYWLKGQGTLDQAEATVFETGSDRWRRHASWPPKAAVERRLYLRANGRLSFDPPIAGEDGAARFVSDPADPVPYRERAAIKPFMSEGSTWSTWLADDQAPFVRRRDVLFWQSEPLEEDVTITGKVAAKLFAATTGTDADWVVKLIDVHPSDASTPAELRGRQRMIANDVFRARFRTGYEKPKPLTPDAVLPYDIDLHQAAHVFRRGHRIAVQVQSSWFPLIDRNPQTFVPNILRAKPGDFRRQTHSVHHGPRHPSAISVLVMPSG